MKSLKEQIKACILLVIFILTISFPVLAEESQSDSNQKKIESARLIKEKVSAEAGEVSAFADSQSEFSIVRLFQGFGLCVAIFLIGIHLYKKYILKDDFKTERSLRVLEKIPLSGKSHLCLVQYNDKKLLMAVGSENVSFYHDSDILNSLGDFNEESAYLPEKELCKDKVN